MTLPHTGGGEWASSQASPWDTVNLALRGIDAFAVRAIIQDRDLTAPPGSCSDGACYLVKATATGAWASKDGLLAVAKGANASNGWIFVTVAVEGFTLYVRDEDITIEHNGTSWVSLNAAPTEASASEIWAGSSTTKFVSPSKALAAGAPTSLTSGTTITPDGANGLNFTLTLAHNATLANPSNFGTGRSGVIVITQDGTGSRTMAFGSNWKFPSGAPTLSTAAGSVDLLSYYVVSGSLIVATLTKAYSS